jgi:imidazole glycerol-phosphate synthase subunit HisH
MSASLALIDYGMGNLFSVKRSFQAVGAEACVIDSPSDLAQFTHAVLPGVGAFSDGMKNLVKHGWVEALQDFSTDRYLMGICLGMQLLVERGYEFDEVNGLGLIAGNVIKLQQGISQKLPHVGWNQIKQLRQDPIFEGVADEEDFYFVHSYHVDLSDPRYALSTTSFGQTFFSAIRKDNVLGFQCHPEKSGQMGLKILKNFLEFH